MRIVLIIMSLPFFLFGFLWAFIKQGFDDGVKAEQNIERYYKDL